MKPVPDPPELSARARGVRERLTGTTFADVRWLPETGSTNADVLELIRSGEPEGIVVVADHQTAGRGRRGRSWEAPPDASLMLTVLMRPVAAVAGLTTMALALAASDAVADLTGVVARLKWPNDLVWAAAGSHDRKLAGILAEAEWPAGATASGGPVAPAESQRVAVAAGIGLNVAWGDAFPEELKETAVALDEIVAPQAPPDRADLLVALLTHLDRHHRDLSGADGATRLMERWRDRSATLGRMVRVDLGADDVEGTAVDVTAEGHLVVESLDGTTRTVAVGDVVHLRNAI
ncbi:MAG: biotin--[acetyl-CoA-carboxylase] ligase [Acidimicrobiales bacterium]|nr:biotin--[acetyl-CoA-carboxylase] ligase [Acidimicrobiales bacterium]